MQLTLRKANKIQNSILEMIKGLEFKTLVRVNEFEDMNEQIDAVHSEFFTHRATRDKLVGALYEIRKSVARANADNMVNDMLADVAMLEKQIQFVSTYADQKPRESDAVINGKLDKLKKAKDDYYRSDEVSTGIFSKEEVTEFKRELAELKRQKQDLQDSLLELNVQTTIELDEETERFLQRADVL